MDQLCEMTLTKKVRGVTTQRQVRVLSEAGRRGHRDTARAMSTVKAIVRLVVPAGAAKPGPAIGQALGPHGLNMVEFCKAFNAATEKMIPETPIPVKLTAFKNRTFTFITKVSSLLKIVRAPP